MGGQAKAGPKYLVGLPDGVFVRRTKLPKKLSETVSTEQFGLLEHRLDRFVLQVRRVAVFIQDALHHDPKFCPRTFSEIPVNTPALASWVISLATVALGL